MSNKRRIQYIVLISELILIFILGVIIGQVRKTVNERKALEADVDTRLLPSIFSVLPYEGETFSIYYYSDEQQFTIQIWKEPYSTSLDNAMFFLHQYDETRAITEEDVRIVTSGVMESGQ